MLTKILILLTCIYKDSAANMEPKVVGLEADILYYPHSAFILVVRSTGSYICGSSILNQRILLTAAHCIEGPFLKASTVYIGHSNRAYGDKYPVAATKQHQSYDPTTVDCDIGLILVIKDIVFGKGVQRVSITHWQQSRKVAAVAGWGMIDEDIGQGTQHLHYAILHVIPYEECRKLISSLPEGCICARSDSGKHYPSAGDSGSALVVKGYIQIGVVSFKRPDISRSVVAFTDVTYFYKWIRINSKRLHCYSDL